GEPKYGDHRAAEFFLHLLCKVNGADRFKDRIERSAVKPQLLTGNNRQRILLLQPLQVISGSLMLLKGGIKSPQRFNCFRAIPLKIQIFGISYRLIAAEGSGFVESIQLFEI